MPRNRDSEVYAASEASLHPRLNDLTNGSDYGVRLNQYSTTGSTANRNSEEDSSLQHIIDSFIESLQRRSEVSDMKIDESEAYINKLMKLKLGSLGQSRVFFSIGQTISTIKKFKVSEVANRSSQMTIASSSAEIGTAYYFEYCHKVELSTHLDCIEHELYKFYREKFVRNEVRHLYSYLYDSQKLQATFKGAVETEEDIKIIKAIFTGRPKTATLQITDVELCKAIEDKSTIASIQENLNKEFTRGHYDFMNLFKIEGSTATYKVC